MNRWMFFIYLFLFTYRRGIYEPTNNLSTHNIATG